MNENFKLEAEQAEQDAEKLAKMSQYEINQMLKEIEADIED